MKPFTQARHLIRRPLTSASMTNPSTRSGSAHPGVKKESLSSHPVMTPSAFYAQAVKMINAVNPFVVSAKAFTPQKLPDKAPAFKCRPCDAGRQLRVCNGSLNCIMAG